MFNLNVEHHHEHTGTHVDAPLHFSEDGQSVAEIPLGNLVVPLAILDIREKADADPDAQVTPDDIAAWIAEHGPLPENCCVAMNSGWDRYVDDAKFRNADEDGTMHFPGFHIEAAQMLMEETSAVGMAVDTLSLDFGPSPDFATHYAWLPTNRWGLECIANLDALPARGATLVVGAPKIRGGTGGPARNLRHGLTSPIPQPGSSCPCLSGRGSSKTRRWIGGGIGFAACSGKLPRSAAGPWFRGSQDSCATSSWPRSWVSAR